MSDLIKKWKSHGDYANGYADAFNGDEYDPDGCELEPYKIGFDAGLRAAQMFQDKGFAHNGDGLSLSFEIGGK